MLKAIYQHQFEKDIKKAKKRSKDLLKLKKIIELLLEDKPLSEKNKNHKLHGDFEDYWECHIEPDWLLVYKKTLTEIIFVRLGSHSDLF